MGEEGEADTNGGGEEREADTGRGRRKGRQTHWRTEEVSVRGRGVGSVLERRSEFKMREVMVEIMKYARASNGKISP